MTENEIVEKLQLLGIRNMKDLRRVTGAGDGCTCCHEELKEYIERHNFVGCGS